MIYNTISNFKRRTRLFQQDLTRDNSQLGAQLRVGYLSTRSLMADSTLSLCFLDSSPKVIPDIIGRPYLSNHELRHYAVRPDRLHLPLTSSTTPTYIMEKTLSFHRNVHLTPTPTPFSKMNPRTKILAGIARVTTIIGIPSRLQY